MNRDRHVLSRLAALALLVLAAAPAAPATAYVPAAEVKSSPVLGVPSERRAEEPGERWRRPVPAAELRPFAAPPSPWGAGHRGVDLGPLSLGTDISAPADGEVSFAGIVVDRPVLSIRHGGGYLSSFEPVETVLKVGDAVSAGDEVGTLGAGNAHCELPCLHWGVRLHGEYINPLLLTGDLEPSVLLPLGED
ncbi:M23 family metallopeptidase [Nesterenkonia lutea]|uniref:Murein DD-endopeptidase MepM/ murein hydrolase activator NlpD n=1 Tax=Nesterenkonia lutea TaxID=272919 RepID=A0ABR9JEV8_9MICC|nr:M23 family metallopeptidase [Nesterenkonia lutea]MBE1524455.1 murein DD-endopeptidase MepM/ murein hydrolase activator NlpD [Nesterenkonia lutea]